METRARILHREKVDDHTLTFSLEKIDELLCAAQAAIPFDNPTVWKEWISIGIDTGQLTNVVLRLDGNPIGSLTFAVATSKIRELVITHAHITDHTVGYVPLLVTFAMRTAKEFQCDYIRFHTVRKGLIREVLKQGFNVSEIVLRKPVSK